MLKYINGWLVISSLGIPAFAYADSTAPALEEIIVTAQKREESEQRVPIAITTIDASRLSQLGLTDTANLQFAVPGLAVTSVVGSFQPYIRGVGNDVTQGVDNSVALNIDGVYIPTLTVQVQDLVGVDRIEVLKGPQGTLYGRNATGGAINIVTKNPDLNESSATVTVGGGNYSEKQYSGYFSAPFTSQLAGNLAVSYREHEPFNRNLLADGPEARKAEDVVIRGKLLYQPLDSLQFLFTASGASKIDDDSAVGQQIEPNSVGSFYGGHVSAIPFETYFNAPPRFDNKYQLYSLRAKADFSPFDAVSISAYQASTAHTAIDFDGTDAPIFYYDTHNRSDTFTQEFQLLSKPASIIQWIAGLYYLNGEFQFRPISLIAPPAPTYIRSRDTTQSYAGFGQATYPIIDNLSITAGIRYTHDKKAIPVDDFIAGGVTTNFGSCLTCEHTWTKTTPKATLDYQWTPNILFWLSAGRGFKSGGYNPAAPTELGPVNPEVLDAIEAGIKSDLLDNRVRVNLSLYHYKVSNLQVQVITSSSNGGSITENAASARIQGGELEASAKITNNLRLDAGVAVIDGKYTSFPNFAAYVPNPPFPGNVSLQDDATGNPTTRSPKHTFNLGAVYEQPLPSGKVVLSGLYAYSDKYNFDAAQESVQHAFGIANGSIGYISASTQWRVSLWGQNLTNKNYFAANNVNVLGTFVTYAAPRTYGGTVSYSFF